jgi:hypothetical protein
VPPLAVSLVSFSCRWLTHRAARYVVRFFLVLTICPSRPSLYRLFLSLVDVFAAALLYGSLNSLLGPQYHPLDRSSLSAAPSTARLIAHLSFKPARPPPGSLITLSHPSRRSPDHLFLCLARSVARGIAHCFPFQQLMYVSIATSKSFGAISLTLLTNHCRVACKRHAF